MTQQNRPSPLLPIPARPISASKRLRRFLLGAPISSEHLEHTLLPKFLALPVFASDAISSVAYATQQIVLALGAAGLWISEQRAAYTHYTLLTAGLIALLLIVVVTSYWQTIFAYPKGGGSYIVTNVRSYLQRMEEPLSSDALYEEMAAALQQAGIAVPPDPLH